MKNILKRAISLYPRAWRTRYGREFIALLDEVPATWTTVFDVFGGAIKMQMKIWGSWKIVAAFAALGIVASVGYSLTIPDRYVSTAMMTIDQGGLEGVDSIVQRMESRSSLTQLINEQNIYARERARAPIEDVIEQMKAKDIRVGTVKSTTGAPDAIFISFTAGDAARARQTAGALMDHFIRAGMQEDSAAPRHAATLVEAPSLAVQVSPRRSRIIVMGAAAGLVVGLLFALFHGLKVWKLAVPLGISGAILVGVASYLVPDRFSSSAVLAYRSADQAQVPQMIGTVTSGESLHAMVLKFGLYPNESGADRRLSEHLHVQQIPNRRAILIQFDYPDQHVVQNVTQNVVAQFVKMDWNLEIVERPNFPQTPVFPDRSKLASMGLFVGLVVAAIVGIRERRVQHA